MQFPEVVVFTLIRKIPTNGLNLEDKKRLKHAYQVRGR